MTLRISVDIGGTFTDAACMDAETGTVTTTKTSSTTHRFDAAVLTVLDRLKTRPGRTYDELLFASTIFINALIGDNLSRTALVTTKGFRDVIEIGRGNRPDMYNFMYQKAPPFVPRNLRYEVDERIDPEGHVITPLRPEELESLGEMLRDEAVESVAVVFLHSYANPRHEQECRRLLEGILGADVPIVTSSDVAPLWLEFKRTVSTVANASLTPLARRVFEALAETVVTRVARALAIKSNGGITSFERASRSPIHLIESGPAGGVIGSRAVGKSVGTDEVISFDVGGTTAKCALIAGGRIPYTLDYVLRPHESLVAGYPLRTPTIDIVEIGAGGGSIAAVDSGGRLSVGPKSAGADPGPIAYGRGGSEPTLTDALLLAGCISSERFAGGEIRPVIGTVEQAFDDLARRWRRTRDETVAGVIVVAQTKMANAVKLVSVKRGYDPRDFTLVAFGGGGPIHACVVSETLGIGRILIPRNPSVFSALGMLSAEMREDAVATWRVRLAPGIMTELSVRIESLAREAVSRLAGLGAASDVSVDVTLDMRYVGQEHSVTVPMPRQLPAHDELVEMFEQQHIRAYRFVTGDPVEIVNLRVVASSPAAFSGAGTSESVVPATNDAVSSRGGRDILVHGEWMAARVHQRAALPVESLLQGPAVIEESGTSTMLPSGWTASVLATRDLLLTRGNHRRE